MTDNSPEEGVSPLVQKARVKFPRGPFVVNSQSALSGRVSPSVRLSETLSGLRLGPFLRCPRCLYRRCPCRFRYPCLRRFPHRRRCCSMCRLRPFQLRHRQRQELLIKHSNHQEYRWLHLNSSACVTNLRLLVCTFLATASWLMYSFLSAIRPKNGMVYVIRLQSKSGSNIRVRQASIMDGFVHSGH